MKSIVVAKEVKPHSMWIWMDWYVTLTFYDIQYESEDVGSLRKNHIVVAMSQWEDSTRLPFLRPLYSVI